METFLYIVFFLSCIVMVVSVLLQPGKTDAGALFTSGVSSAAMNPRGTASVLSKLTIITATVFMLSALLLSLPALTGKVSVLQTQGENSSTSATTDTNSNSNSENTNAGNTSDSNTAGSSNTSEDTEAKPAEESESSSDEKKADEEKTEEKSGAKADESKDSTEDKKEENK